MKHSPIGERLAFREVGVPATDEFGKGRCPDERR